MPPKKRGLGRGLDALLRIESEAANDTLDGALQVIDIDALSPGRYQPRKRIDDDALAELAASIGSQGIIQPILVRPLGKGRFEIIAGERRWRAARLAGLQQVPCVIRDADDRATVAIALIENIQREDLAPLEEAAALQRLIEEFGLTHEQAAEAVGRSRASVSNLLRLLSLPKGARALLESGKIDMGHARALLTLPVARAEALAVLAAAQGWSVRELEAKAKNSEAQRSPVPTRKPAIDADVQRLATELSEMLATPVAIEHGRGGRGKLVLRYFSLDELDGLIERLRGKP